MKKLIYIIVAIIWYFIIVIQISTYYLRKSTEYYVLATHSYAYGNEKEAIKLRAIGDDYRHKSNFVDGFILNLNK